MGKKTEAAGSLLLSTAGFIVAAPFVLVDPTGTALVLTAAAGGSALKFGADLIDQIAEEHIDRERQYQQSLTRMSPAQLRDEFTTQSFRLGKASVGVFIDGVLSLAIPATLFGMALNCRQLHISLRRQKSIRTVATQQYPHLDFDHVKGKRREFTAGATMKILLSIVCYDAKDVMYGTKHLAEALFGSLSPLQGDELLMNIKDDYGKFTTNSVVHSVQQLAALPADKVSAQLQLDNHLKSLRIVNPDHPSWANLATPSVAAAIGDQYLAYSAAAAVNVPMMVGDKAVDRGRLALKGY